VYAWATWRTPFVRWIILGLNALMLAATPIHGSHYLVDLLAGIAVAMLSIGVTALMFDRFNSRIRRDRAVRADALAGS